MTWESSDDKWHGTYEYNIIAPNAYLHPHDNDTALGWKAPEQGKINITGNIKKDNISCGDGVNIKIMKNDTQMWPEKGWQHINADDNKGVNHDIQVEVNQNDMVYFIVNKNENQYCDGTIWNPSIDYVNEDINTSAIKIIKQVEQLAEDDEIYSEQTVRSLKIHLTSVAHYEDKSATKKVVKHMGGFKILLEHQKNNKQISHKAYKKLLTDANLMIDHWK